MFRKVSLLLAVCSLFLSFNVSQVLALEEVVATETVAKVYTVEN